MRTDPADRDTVTRLAVQHVLTALRLDQAATDRLLAAMNNDELRKLLAGAVALSGNAMKHLTARQDAPRPGREFVTE